MADEWEDVNNHDEWQDVGNGPADANLGPLQFNANHPYLASTLAPMAKGAYDAVKFIPGMKDMLGPGRLTNPINGNKFGIGPDINQIMGKFNPIANSTISDVAYGVGGAVPTIAMANPLIKGAGALPFMAGKLGMGGITPAALGFGAFEGAKAGIQGQPIAPAAAQGAMSGAAFGIGGKLGSTIADRALNPIARAIGGQSGDAISKFAPNIGTAVGMAGAGAITAPEGQRIPSAILGAGMGAISPMNPINTVTPEQYGSHLDTVAKGYQKVLNPGKNVLNSNIDVYNAMETLAKRGVVIKSDVNNKLDNSYGIQQLQQANKPYFDMLQEITSSDPHKQFDLEQIREDAKDQMEPYFKNAEELHRAQSQVDSAIDAEIGRHGKFVNAPKLMSIKQGMYERAFDPLQPTSNDGARAIGSAAKNVIEEAFPESGISEINSKIGDNLEAIRLLESTNGGVVQRGKLGKYAAQLTGAMALDKIPIVGPVIGGTLGGGISDFMNSPERITSGLSSKLGRLRVINPISETKRIGTAIPEVFNPINRMNALPNNTQQPLGLPNIFSDRAPTPPIQDIIRQGSSGKQNSPINMPNPVKRIGFTNYIGSVPEKPYVPGQESIIHNQGYSVPTTEGLDIPTEREKGGGLSPTMRGAFGTAAALGVGSMFNPLNAQASQVKEPERLQLPGDQYTKKEEGFQAHPYIDTKGNKTIGYGFKMDAVGKYLPDLVKQGKRPLTKDEADKIYTKLYTNARNSAQSFAGDSWHSLNGQQQKALTDMSYNMGGKLNGFKKLRQAIQDGNFNSASNEIINSAYAKQAKNRASRNAALIAMK